LAPPSRQATAVALTQKTLTQLKAFGFPVNGDRLSVVVAKQDTFLKGLLQNSSYFELPGLFDALSTIARLFNMPQGRSPDELREMALVALGNATVAYYDHISKALYIRDDADARMLNLESLIAHELVHAYQDQAQGGLDAFIRANRSSLDSLRAAHGVLEGQAVVVGAGVEWFQRGVSVDRMEPDLADTSVGRLAAGESFSIVYEAGRRFVLMRYRDRSSSGGGWPSVADAFTHPPTSTEQLLHPEKFRRDLPTTVSLPQTPTALQSFPIVFDGVVGELLIYNRLLLVARDLNQARHAAAGWDGDRLQVYQLPDGGYAAMWRIVWDRRKDAEQFEAVLKTTLRSRPYVSVKLRGRTTDIAYAESKTEFDALVHAMSTHVEHPVESKFDAETTAAVEAGWDAAERQRPTVRGERWVVPEFGFSFAIPKHYVAVTVRGVDLLATMPIDGFANNVNLAYEQDFFDGNLERYLEEARRQTRLTSQKWLSHRIIEVGKSKGAVIELEVQGGQHLVNLAMAVLPRQNMWVTITCAALANQRGMAEATLAGIIQSLRFE
jgi:hypothetical protein